MAKSTHCCAPTAFGCADPARHARQHAPLLDGMFGVLLQVGTVIQGLVIRLADSEMPKDKFGIEALLELVAVEMAALGKTRGVTEEEWGAYALGRWCAESNTAGSAVRHFLGLDLFDHLDVNDPVPRL